MYTLIIIATITRFGTIAGAGVTFDHIQFQNKQVCESALEKVKKQFDDNDADGICVQN